MMLFFLCGILALILFVFACLILYARWYYGTLEALGIPVVKPSFFLGSDPQGFKSIQHLSDMDRFNTYGQVYGVYEGRSPQIHVCDPDMIRLIMVKDYNHFNERREGNLGHSIPNQILDCQPEDKWKFMRSMMSANFGSHKIKIMCSQLQDVTCEHIKELKNNQSIDNSPTFEFRRFLAALISDMIGQCYCGIKIDNRFSPNNDFSLLMYELIKENVPYDIKHELTRSFPFLINWYPIMPTTALDSFRSLIQGIINTRKKVGENTGNFADVISEIVSKISTHDYKRLNIVEDTAVASALEFFLATFDSVTTPICLLAYYLAKNEDIQNKLVAEIDTVSAKHGGKINYEAIHEMPFLTICIREALRLTPAFIRVSRICSKDWNYKNLTIKKGMTVVIPIWTVNHHPDYYEEPDRFKPERFAEDKEKTHSYAFATFGHGPKNCIGERWANVMSKIIMATFIQEFRFKCDENTKLQWKPGSSFILRFEPLLLKLERRMKK